MNQLAPQDIAQPIQLAVFRVGRYVCAISIDRIQEINKNLQFTQVHEAPPYVSGIINLRGNVVTVLDLRLKLGLQSIRIDGSTRNIIVKSDREMVGLLVDAVDDIIDVETGTILPPPAHLEKSLGDAFSGVVPLNEELVAVLDLDHLLADSPQK